jgi:hypothetical protein
VKTNNNALIEFKDIFVALDFDQEQFLHIDDQPEFTANLLFGYIHR